LLDFAVRSYTSGQGAINSRMLLANPEYRFRGKKEVDQSRPLKTWGQSGAGEERGLLMSRAVSENHERDDRQACQMSKKVGGSREKKGRDNYFIRSRGYGVRVRKKGTNVAFTRRRLNP